MRNIKLQEFKNNPLRLWKEIGWMAILALGGLVLVTLFLWVFFPVDGTKLTTDQKQYEQINAIEVKNASPYYLRFLEAVKENEGWLCMGTSESGNLDGKNYYHFLNADPEIEAKFSVFYGAGRFAHVYVPYMLHDPEAWKDQKMLVFVNPTYYRNGLHIPSSFYDSRYISQEIFDEVYDQLESQGSYDGLFQSTFAEASMIKQLKRGIGKFLDEEIRALYYKNFNENYKRQNSPYTEFSEVDFEKMVCKDSLEEMRALIDTSFGISHDFRKLYPERVPHYFLGDDNSYRHRTLNEFIKTCKLVGAKPTFIIGPFNQTLLENYADASAPYYTLFEELRNLFEKANVPFIDLSAQSLNPYFFNDMQHQSQYGGYLTYKAIKKYINEK